MRMIHEFTWRVAASLPKVIGKVPFGTRMYHELPEVELTGERLNARSITPGGDWILAADDGWAHIDVRAQLRADDGALIYVRYEGWIEPTDKLQAAVQSLTPTDFEDQAIHTSWRFECGDERHAWLNRSVFVGQGRLLPAGPGMLGMEHNIYRLAQDT
jgi:hypothetical protein